MLEPEGNVGILTLELIAAGSKAQHTLAMALGALPWALDTLGWASRGPESSLESFLLHPLLPSASE